jgi:hypothetical protein
LPWTRPEDSDTRLQCLSHDLAALFFFLIITGTFSATQTVPLHRFIFQRWLSVVNERRFDEFSRKAGAGSIIEIFKMTYLKVWLGKEK